MSASIPPSATSSKRTPCPRNTAKECQAVAALHELDPALLRTASGPSELPGARIPVVSIARLAQARGSCEFDDTRSDTVLYLAYGSNMCAATFEGSRGIRPLAAINVVVPKLAMTFDLPGIPFHEPCFSTINYSTTSVPGVDDYPVEKSHLLGQPMPEGRKEKYGNPAWPHGLVGVVYEVTKADYAHIIVTEGGGSSYQEMKVLCYDLPKGSTTVPDDFETKPFEAHTLFTPRVDGRLERGRDRMLGYAQPSLRYLTLLRDGAREHDLPGDYQAYLHSLEPYTITTTRQRLGKWIAMMAWGPWLLFLFAVAAMCADQDGRKPKWFARLSERLFDSIWCSYDDIFKRIFGDGERTMKKSRI